MQAVYQWAMSVAAIGVLSALFEMLLPSGNIKKFGRVALVLAVVVALLKPILMLIKTYA